MGRNPERLRQELKKIHSITKITTIHVTHSFEEAFFLGDRMAVMDKGEIIQLGKPNEVFRKPNSKFVADFLGVRNLFEGESGAGPRHCIHSKDLTGQIPCPALWG
jgi:molybdate transport system ATP-binding protein/molybdate/tungstate transport system ATP-binding protein